MGELALGMLGSQGLREMTLPVMESDAFSLHPIGPSAFGRDSSFSVACHMPWTFWLPSHVLAVVRSS